MVKVTGGDKLERALRDLATKVARPGTLKVGFLAGGTYPDGTSIPFVAAMNEFGNGLGRPPRPFFRRMVHLGSPHWAADLAKLLKVTGYDVPRTLGLMGEQMSGELVQSIADQVYAPLAPSTIARKGFATTLVDTSVMINSVKAEVQT